MPDATLFTLTFADATADDGLRFGVATAPDIDAACDLVPGAGAARAAGRLHYTTERVPPRRPCFRFHQRQGGPVWAESWEDALERHGPCHPRWDAALLEDGRIVLRAGAEQAGIVPRGVEELSHG